MNLVRVAATYPTEVDVVTKVRSLGRTLTVEEGTDWVTTYGDAQLVTGETEADITETILSHEIEAAYFFLAYEPRTAQIPRHLHYSMVELTKAGVDVYAKYPHHDWKLFDDVEHLSDPEPPILMNMYGE